MEDMEASDKIYLGISQPGANGQSPSWLETPSERGFIAVSFSESFAFNQISKAQQRLPPVSAVSQTSSV